MIYKIDYTFGTWECEIEILDTDKAKEAIKNMVEFWADWEKDLKNNGGDYNKTFVCQITTVLAEISIGKTHHGVLCELEEMEGYYPLDGSYDIRLVDVDTFRFDIDDFTIVEEKEVTNE